MRYSRQETVSFIPVDFHKKIQDKKLIIVGCGGVGSILSEMLVRGGFLNITLIDNDIIDESNLQRQTFYEDEIGESKSKTLKKHLERINSKANITTYPILLEKENIEDLCSNSDLIIDATDNIETRKIINEYCEMVEKDWIYNGAIKTEIISCIFLGKEKLFDKVFSSQIKNEKCCEVGVLASTTHAAASLTYNQVLKYFLGEDLYKLIKMDLWNNKIFEIKIK